MRGCCEGESHTRQRQNGYHSTPAAPEVDKTEKGEVDKTEGEKQEADKEN